MHKSCDLTYGLPVTVILLRAGHCRECLAGPGDTWGLQHSPLQAAKPVSWGVPYPRWPPLPSLGRAVGLACLLRPLLSPAWPSPRRGAPVVEAPCTLFSGLPDSGQGGLRGCPDLWLEMCAEAQAPSLRPVANLVGDPHLPTSSWKKQALLGSGSWRTRGRQPSGGHGHVQL